jgi:hypothetical protein
VTHHPSRKHFLAKLLGAVAAAGVIPKVAAKAASAGSAASNPPSDSARTLVVRHDARAIARRDTV